MIECVSTTPERQAGTPKTPDMLTRVEPPERVVIDLLALYGRHPLFRRPNVLVLPQLDVIVVALLEAWVLSESGWFGHCRYRVKIRHGDYLDQAHLVPVRMMRPVTEFEVQQAVMRGELDR